MHYIALVIIFVALVFDRLNIFLYLIISSFCHEAGHILVCRMFGQKPIVHLSVFGAKLSGYPVHRWKKLAVLIAGPFINFIFLIFSCLMITNHFSLDVYVFGCINAVILIFNMLPVSFLDGGQIIAVFCSDSRLQKLLDFISFTSIFALIIIFSSNIYLSFAAVAVFVIYYLLNV